jgi:hypothetical protein
MAKMKKTKETDFLKYTDPSFSKRTTAGSDMAPVRERPTYPLKYAGNPRIDVTEYKPDSEKRMARILRASQDADGLGVFTSKSVTGKKIR